MKNTKILFFIPLGLLFFLLTFSKCQTLHDRSDSQSNTTKESKQKGAHVFGRLDSTDFKFLTRNNIEWVTLVPWGSQKDYNSPIVRHQRGDSLHTARRDSSFLKRIELVHNAGFKVFVKPHIWIHSPSDGKWRSDIYPTSDENWKLWQESYREFILRYARLAQQANAEMFCVGTELTRISVEKPIFWGTLIKEVKAIYSGKITYAANWYNEYEKVEFWDNLDYIGIQAYFPLVENKNPSTQQISEGWSQYLPTLKAIHDKHKRKVLFTELGYKSTADSAEKPWEWVDNPETHDKSLSNETQVNCYEAFFDIVWEKEWFAGVHIWQLRPDYEERHRGENHLDFTPLGKPAEGVIAKGFK